MNMNYIMIPGLKFKEPLKNGNKKNRIIETVCSYFVVDIKVLKSPKRDNLTAEARQIAMFFFKKYTTMSLKEIGIFFGGRDHTTVIHSCTVVEDHFETEELFRIKVNEIENIILS